MSSNASPLPNDIEALQSLLLAERAKSAKVEADAQQLCAEKQSVVDENARLTAKVFSLQEQLNLALARRYAASSEKLSPDQIRLFDEAEKGSKVTPDEEPEDGAGEGGRD